MLQQWPLHQDSALTASEFICLPVKLLPVILMVSNLRLKFNQAKGNKLNITTTLFTNCTSQWRLFQQVVPCFLGISVGMQILILESARVTFISSNKTANKAYVFSKLVYFPNNVSLITVPKLYFKKPAIVKKLIINLFVWTPCTMYACLWQRPLYSSM